MSDRIIPLIMCGGAGTRLWPASREALPKQFISLFGARSTFQDTLLRVSDASLFDRPIVITNVAYRFMVLEQISEIGLAADILLEPMRRDSGPAIAAGAAFAQSRDANAVVLALAADHVVDDAAAFVKTCRQGLAGANAGNIVTFGITPNRAASDYGYINPGPVIVGDVRATADFVEKPDAATAAKYVAAGYFWNSGNFMFRAAMLLDEYRNVDAASVDAVTDAVRSAHHEGEFVVLDEAAFAKATSISIDYAVMEKTKHAAVVPLMSGWSDVGSWRVVWELSDKDDAGNSTQGPSVFEDSRNCSVSTDRALVALEGVEDLVVVATTDAVLVSSQKDANGMKRLIAKLKTAAPQVTQAHVRLHTPWGSLQSLDRDEGHQVSRIIVKPGGTLSEQTHRDFDGHWIVVRGEARVTLQGSVRIVQENESIHIPKGMAHRLDNLGQTPLVLIEVQTGRA